MHEIFRDENEIFRDENEIFRDENEMKYLPKIFSCKNNSCMKLRTAHIPMKISCYAYAAAGLGIRKMV